MGCAYGNEDAGFADFEAAETVGDGNAMDEIFFAELSTNLAHFSEGHGFVGFVLEVERGAIVGLIADEAVEGDDGAVFGGADLADESGHVNRLAG